MLRELTSNAFEIVTTQQFSFSIFEDALWGLARFFEE